MTRKRYVVASFRFGGLHAWESQPEGAVRSYLKTLHRHEFHVEVGVPVVGADRDVEILDLKNVARRAVEEEYEWSKTSLGDLFLGECSCEMIADVVHDVVVGCFGACAWVRVLEDGENGALTTWEDLPCT